MVSALSSEFQNRWPRIRFMTFGASIQGPFAQIKTEIEFREEKGRAIYEKLLIFFFKEEITR